LKIIDTSPLICIIEEIDEPGILDDLRQMNSVVIIPTGVKDEITLDPAMTVVDGYCTKGDYKNRSPDTGRYNTLKNRYPNLGRGELEVMALAQELIDEGEDPLCVLDDGLARKTANSLGLRYTGIIGILKRLKDSGKISRQECINIATTLEQSPFRIDPVIIRRELLDESD
jgi:predicted nucleic acid-binding protein